MTAQQRIVRAPGRHPDGAARRRRRQVQAAGDVQELRHQLLGSLEPFGGGLGEHAVGHVDNLDRQLRPRVARIGRCVTLVLEEFLQNGTLREGGLTGQHIKDGTAE